MHKKILEAPSDFYGGTKLLHDLNAIEERWTFGFEPAEVAPYLERFGFELLEDLSADDYRDRYMPHRTERGYEFYRVAVGRKLR